MAAGDVTYNAVPEGALPAFASGKVLADADTAVVVKCGFQPSRIDLWYKDTGATTKDAHVLWFSGMTAGYYWNTVLSTGACTETTSGGPTVYAGSGDDGYSEGFTIPAGLMDADSDAIYWIAWR